MNRSKKITTRSLVMIGMLSSIAVVLMFFELPIPFIAPPFYKIDLSEIPVLIGSFVLGPVGGMIIEALKILLHLLLKGSTTMYVGELANFAIGCAFLLPAAWIYNRRRCLKNLVIGLATGILAMVLVGSLMNAYVLLPMYAELYYGGMEPILSAGAAVNANITNITTFVILAVAPFNLIKGVVCALLSYFIFVPLRKSLHK